MNEGELREYDLIVIGGGPAGVSAAVEASRAGMKVCLIEDRPTLGGQIYKQPPVGYEVRQAGHMGKEYVTGRGLIDEIEKTDVEVLVGHTAWGVWDDIDEKTVGVYSSERTSLTLKAPRLIVASGAYDRPVPFPGWTLPGVLTAGGAQSLVKVQKVLPGDRILMVGSGPLILAFSCQLHALGANIIGIVEAAPSPGLVNRVKLATSAGLESLGLLREGIGYLNYVRRNRIPMYYGHAIARALGTTEVTGAEIRRVDDDWNPIAGTELNIDADTVCVGYGFLPSNEIVRSLDCEMTYDEHLGGSIPMRDQFMQTTVPGVYAVGDGSGVAGAPTSIVEGRIAAIDCARRAGTLADRRARVRLRRNWKKLAAINRFRQVLDDTYRIKPGLYRWATPDTVVCRCEEVTAGEIRRFISKSDDPNYVKSLTRASMGLCQGRNCSRQVSWIVADELGGSHPSSRSLTPRPPIKPVPLGAIARLDSDPNRGNLPMLED